ncbi:sulfotransferase family protein [Sphingomonas glaciei]|uniref:Sulfotransferase n=1 Tax=Sphingomonas glaciei TaxID=2938948 RepID=A0ABY5MV84_9SPHN|nr:sulfotransferase [Sphingomonas glaciei]UUR08390.1 sulfotransferase [Sphingomonas glaciei]
MTLDPQEIEAFVRRRTGTERIGGEHWRPWFALLAEQLEQRAALSPLGRIIANGQLVGLLTARVRAERLLARRPEIAQMPIRRPIIVMGPMRSGSTRVQRLLACDRRFAWTRLYEGLFPVPYARGDRRRIVAAACVHRLLRSLNPAVQQIHPSGATQPDEEFGHLSFSMTSAQAAVQWHVPDLVAAERTRDWSPVVAELATLLRLNVWARGAKGEKRWVLKCPAYGDMADALFDAFPDASVIHLSRDPLKVVASSASLVFEQRRIHSDAVDAEAIGAEWLERTLQRQRRQDAARQCRSDVAAFDLPYEDVSGDWRGAMERVYRFLGEPLTAETTTAMKRYLAGSSEHEGHRYDPQTFGIEEQALRRAFGERAAPTVRGFGPRKPAPSVPALAAKTAFSYS